MLANHRLSPHSPEFIDDFKVRVKQTVWLINTKLDKSILKLRLLKSKLAIAECDKNTEANGEMTIDYVLEMA
jgi:hypothetical protein